jgi:ubiquinone/menaquinone biosynthesis C-methylase UbiE
MEYPKYEIYQKMYKRFFHRNMEYFVKLVKIKKDDEVLDLCGGNGRLTKKLLKRTKNVYYLDGEKKMIPKFVYQKCKEVYNQRVEDFIKVCSKKFNYIFCIQAINYWFNNIDVKDLAKKIITGGKFIFNTFNTRPSVIPFIKQYVINNKNYLEVSYLVKNKVEHIQIMEGQSPHFTEFDFIDKNKYISKLSKYFNVEVITDNKTDIYICERK